ncbi:dehydrogenase [bacterium]|nr:dehydrogenase [bacterium]
MRFQTRAACTFAPLTTPAVIPTTSELDPTTLIELYKALSLPRAIEEKMLILLRQGKISKWFSGYGQEAISVGCALAMEPDEYLLTMHRNLGVFTARNVPLERLFMQFQGKPGGFTKGRDRSFHFGTNEHHIVGMISHLGPQLGVADGIALAHKLKEEQKCCLVFTGDGGASEGDFHESLNVAAVWKLPVLFVVENNQWGLSTPSSEQFACKQFIDKGIGYGMETVQIDGNQLLEVYETIRAVAADVRLNPRPILIECITFRMRGHEEASGTKYYPEGLQDQWAEKDPLLQFERFLAERDILDAEGAEAIRQQHREAIVAALDVAFAAPAAVWDEAREKADLYAPHQPTLDPNEGEVRELRLIDAVSEALGDSMERFPELVLMGQDIGAYGGVFKVTEGFVDRFGAQRVRNTPLCESAILGAGLGLSIRGMKAMVEMQFADFVSEGITQICNNLAKIHYRWGQNADVVVRMPTGAGVAAGPFHSQSNEAWFAHTPGLKVLYPAFPADAKGLLCAALEDPNPVLFFEHKALYRSVYGPVPLGWYALPFGVASVLREGPDFSIVTYGMGVHWALELLDRHPDWKADLIDLRTLVPLDEEAIYASARKTGRVLVLTEDVLTGGFGADLAALIQEHCFDKLDAPVLRVASHNLPVPFAPELEQGFLAKSRLEESIERLLGY